MNPCRDLLFGLLALRNGTVIAPFSTRIRPSWNSNCGIGSTSARLPDPSGHPSRNRTTA